MLKYMSIWWYAVTRMIEALILKPEGRRFDRVIGIFHRHNTSGRTMALRSIQPLTEISIRNISWGGGGTVYTADNITTFISRQSPNSKASKSWACNRPV